MVLFIFMSSSCPENLTLGNVPDSFPEHLTLEAAKVLLLGLGLGSALVSSLPIGYILLTIIHT